MLNQNSFKSNKLAYKDPSVLNRRNKKNLFLSSLLITGVTPNIMSPDNLWQSDGKGASYAGTPTEFRRESIRSSLSMMKV